MTPDSLRLACRGCGPPRKDAGPRTLESRFNEGVRLRQGLLIAFAVAVGACGGGEAGSSYRPEPEIQAAAKPIWCPTAHAERRGSRGNFDARRLLGLAEREARTLAERNDCVVRVVRRDGQPLDTTADLNFYRINVGVNDNVVTRIEDVG